ncbi:hypothetical protein JW752_00795 [Candidatus Peregrinibacteria bacterium]|nr:hypothetical protein [Candidatus Peregrinibacteria bacterium]
MKKLLAIIVFCLLGATSFLVAPVTNAAYDNFPPGNEQFHPKNPDYYDGNLRLELKKRADIERASAPNLHYDEQTRDYYRCDWIYNKNLGTWVCEKSYSNSYASSAHPVTVCPFGYTKHPVQQTCVAIRPPANASLNSQGNNWQCNSGYHVNSAGTGCDRNDITYYYYSDEPQYEVTKYVYYYGDNLPQTGPGMSGLLLISALGGLMYLRKKDNLN